MTNEDVYYLAEVCEKLLNEGAYKEVIKKAEFFIKSRNEYNACYDAETMIYIFYAESLINIDKDNFDKAVSCMLNAEQSLNLIEDKDTREYILLSLNISWSKILYDAAFYEESAQYAYEVISICEECDYRKEQYLCAINNFILCLYQEGDIEAGWSCINKGLDCIVSEGLEESALAVYLYQACSLFSGEQLDKELCIREQTQKLFEKAIMEGQIENWKEAKLAFLRLYEMEKKMHRLFSRCTLFVSEYPEMIRTMFEAADLKELLFALIKQEHDVLNKLIHIKNHAILLKMTNGMHRIMSQILSYNHANMIECTDEELLEMIVNCKSIYPDVLYRSKIADRDMIKVDFRWISYEQICSMLPEHAVYIDYVQYPIRISQEQYLGELCLIYFSLSHEDGKFVLKHYPSLNLLFTRMEYMKLMGFVRTKKPDVEKAAAELCLGKEKDIAWNLYAFVLKPVIDGIGKDIDTIIVSGDVEMNVYPFAMLADENEESVINRYQMVYVNSIRNYRGEKKYFLKDFLHPLIIGNPKFMLDNSLNEKEHASGLLLPLPLSKIEVNLVADILNVKAFTGKQARKQELLNTEYDLLHIATHGDVRDVEQDEEEQSSSLNDSCIYFSGASDWLLSGKETEGFGTGIATADEISEIYTDKLKLIVFSTCFSGYGNVNYSQGLVGMRTALLTLGASSIILSLWEVDDFASAVLMSYFYRMLNENTASAALRKAQLYLREVTICELTQAGWFDNERIKKIGLAADAMRAIAKLSGEKKVFHSYKYWAGYICLDQN